MITFRAAAIFEVVNASEKLRICIELGLPDLKIALNCLDYFNTVFRIDYLSNFEEVEEQLAAVSTEVTTLLDALNTQYELSR